MDFELSEDQSAVMDAVERLLAEHAGAARAITLQEEGAYDDALHAALAESGFLDVAGEDGMGGLEAALVTEAVARAGGVVSAGACAMIAGCTPGLDPGSAMAVVDAGDLGSPIRYLGAARTLLILEPDAVRAIEVGPGSAKAVASNFGYPMGRLAEEPGTGRLLEDVSADRMRARWRLALAAEIVGTMDAALAETVAYLKERRQFGRAIGSFQGVQHRLALCAIEVEAARWLVREAAHHEAPDEAAAAAASFATSASDRVFADTHQLSGAIGFTREHDLHVWSMRLQALRLELGGVRAHRRALAHARWGTAPA